MTKLGVLKLLLSKNSAPLLFAHFVGDAAFRAELNDAGSRHCSPFI
jgi:hypothetical protein